LWKTFQSPRKRLSRHIPSHITRVSNRPNGNCTTYFHLLRVICQLAPNVSRSSHIPPLLLDTLGSAKPLALTGFFFRSWRHRHTYRGDLLDFLHALPARYSPYTFVKRASSTFLRPLVRTEVWRQQARMCGMRIGSSIEAPRG
jgi:hypothetical protein